MKMTPLPKEEIFRHLIEKIQAEPDPKGMLWATLLNRMLDLGCTIEEVNTSILELIDYGILQDDRLGWLKVDEEGLKKMEKWGKTLTEAFAKGMQNIALRLP